MDVSVSLATSALGRMIDVVIRELVATHGVTSTTVGLVALIVVALVVGRDTVVGRFCIACVRNLVMALNAIVMQALCAFAVTFGILVATYVVVLFVVDAHPQLLNAACGSKPAARWF